MREIEAKFLVTRLEPVRRRVTRLGGRLTARRHLERNWIFDQPGDRLAKAHSQLRLRQDRVTSLTYKRRQKTIEHRDEVGLEVDDPSTAAELLRALGYDVVGGYEKYRREYRLGRVRVMLDELPFGDFVEIEGSSLRAVRDQAERIGLAWNRRVKDSYFGIFTQLRATNSLRFREASFDRFAAHPNVRADRMGLADALLAEARKR